MKKLKVLLLMLFNDSMCTRIEDLGICYIASVTRKNGNEVLLMAKHEHEINFQRISEFGPDIVGFPVYDISKDMVYRVCARLREMFPNILICLGGYLPSAEGKDMMEKESMIDFVIKNEGEIVWSQLITSLEEGKDVGDIKGLIYRNAKGEIIENGSQELIENMDDLPFPARDIGVENKLPFFSISTSRGCTGRCSFCYTHRFWKKWKGRSPKNVVDEIEYVTNTYNARIYHFIDASFEDPGFNFDRMWEIASEIIKRNLVITYTVEVRAEFQRHATDELLSMLKNSGLGGIYVGIEAANEFDLKLYGKNATIYDNFMVVELFRKWGIGLDIGFININPYSNFENIRKNIDFLEKYKLASVYDYIRNSYRAYKGTPLYNKIERDGMLIDGVHDALRRYRFIDERIRDIVEFLQEFNAANGVAVRKTHFPDYMVILEHYKRQFSKKLQCDKAYKIVLDHEKEVNSIISDFSELNVSWYKQIVDLAESGWDRNMADKIKLEATERFQRLFNNFIDEQNRLIFSLMRLGPRYREYICENI
ncbi:MAG: B12-binding domain-containing radical SAM protein [Caulobacteraceae bacterium]